MPPPARSSSILRRGCSKGNTAVPSNWSALRWAPRADRAHLSNRRRPDAPSRNAQLQGEIERRLRLHRDGDVAGPGIGAGLADRDIASGKRHPRGDAAIEMEGDRVIAVREGNSRRPMRSGAMRSWCSRGRYARPSGCAGYSNRRASKNWAWNGVRKQTNWSESPSDCGLAAGLRNRPRDNGTWVFFLGHPSGADPRPSKSRRIRSNIRARGWRLGARVLGARFKSVTTQEKEACPTPSVCTAF